MNRTLMDELKAKRAKLDEQIEAARRMPDFRSLPDGTLLTMQVFYSGQRGASPYTFVALKAAGLWYFTGRGPHAAGPGAVVRWFTEGDRMLARWDGCVLDENAYLPGKAGSGVPQNVPQMRSNEDRYREALEQISSEGTCLCSADNVDCGHFDAAYVADLALGKYNPDPDNVPFAKGY